MSYDTIHQLDMALTVILSMDHQKYTVVALAQESREVDSNSQVQLNVNYSEVWIK
jgi:hypothetical protein